MAWPKEKKGAVLVLAYWLEVVEAFSDHTSFWYSQRVVLGIWDAGSRKLPLSYVHVCSVGSSSLWPHGLWCFCLWDFPGKNTGVVYHFLLQGIVSTQGLNTHVLQLLPWQADSFATEPLGKLSYRWDWVCALSYCPGPEPGCGWIRGWRLSAWRMELKCSDFKERDWMLSCFSHVRLFATQWAVACQAPLCMGFSRQEYCSELLCPSLGDFPNPGIKPASSSLRSALYGRQVLYHKCHLGAL